MKKTHVADCEKAPPFGVSRILNSGPPSRPDLGSCDRFFPVVSEVAGLSTHNLSCQLRILKKAADTITPSLSMFAKLSQQQWLTRLSAFCIYDDSTNNYQGKICTRNTDKRPFEQFKRTIELSICFKMEDG